MKVVIAGYGVEGEVNYRYWSGLGHEVTIADQKETTGKPLPDGVPTILGEDAFEKLNDFDLVVRTASLPPHAISTNGKIWSATNEFFAKCTAPIIGVTGTKGKGTTSSFIAGILEAAGRKVHLLGNIGNPALEMLPDIIETDVVVYELSSFQLWDVKKSPHVAVVLTIEQDHLDVHTSFEEYVSAKGNISRWQKPSDIVVYLPTNEHSQQIAHQSPGTQLPYTKAPGAYVKDDDFWVGEQKVCSIKTVVVPGKHNLENACAAITAAWQFTHDTTAIAQGLSDFNGLPHRLELIRTTNGVRYYDDSYSSAPLAAVVAMHAFTEPKIMILGGYDRDIDFTQLAKEVKKNDIKKVLLIGQTKGRLASALSQQNFTQYELVDFKNMSDIVRKAQAVAQTGDVVVLSPGCPSFDMFKNFSDRGEQFQAAVKGL